MLVKVISGGQTGADQSGWRAAKRCGIVTGGWMPREYLTEDGRKPEFAKLYNAREHPSYGYPPRTESNAFDGDFTLWVGRIGSPGYWCTKKGCTKSGKPFREINEPIPTDPFYISVLADVLIPKFDRDYSVNIAGPRESTQPGIGDRAEEMLVHLFTELNK